MQKMPFVCSLLSWLQFPHSLALFDIKSKRVLVGRDNFVTVKDRHVNQGLSRRTGACALYVFFRVDVDTDGAQHGEGHLAVGGSNDDQHVKACSVKDCSRCKWAGSKTKWQKELPWLVAKINLEKHTWGIGCKLCSEAQRLSPETMAKFPVARHHFARFAITTGEIRVARFRKHVISPAHRTAESLASGKVALPEMEGFSSTQAEWMSVLEHSKPNDCPADIQDVGNRKKVHIMRWCLSEAIRQVQRSFLQDALCVSLQQDARGRRFLVRYFVK